MARASSFEERSASATAPAARRLRRRAVRQLELAQPLAATAAGTDGSYQALAATLSQAGTNSPLVLFPALRAECSAVARRSG